MSETMEWIRKMDKIAEKHGMPQPKVEIVMTEVDEWELEGKAKDAQLEQDALVTMMETISQLIGHSGDI